MLTSKKRNLLFIAAAALLTAGFINEAAALNVGQQVSTVFVRDSQDNPTAIANIGKKVVAIFYSDSDAADLNDPFADRLEKAAIPGKDFVAYGVANLEDSWVPNSIIRWVIRRKEKQYGVTIYTDPDHILKKKWSFKKTDDTQVVIVIGKDKKVYAVNYGKIGTDRGTQLIDLIRKLSAK